MGFIKLTHMDLGAVPINNQLVRVEYRKTVDPELPESYTLVAASALVSPMGDFLPELIISGLLDGVSYTVRIKNNCIDSIVYQEFGTGITTSGPTTTGIPTTTAPVTTQAPTTTVAPTTTGVPTTTLPSCPDIIGVDMEGIGNPPTTTTAPTTTAALPTNITIINRLMPEGTGVDQYHTFGLPMSRLLVTSGPNLFGQAWQNPSFPTELQAAEFGPGGIIPRSNTALLARGGSRTIRIETRATYPGSAVAKLLIFYNGGLYDTKNIAGIFNYAVFYTATFSSAQIAAAVTIEFRIVNQYPV